MSTASAEAPTLMTAEEFARRPDPGHPEELVRGRIVPMPPPTRRHGQICSKSVSNPGRFRRRTRPRPGPVQRFRRDHRAGPRYGPGRGRRLLQLQANPKGPLPADYGEVAPELVVEVRSPTDRWPKILGKVAEYLNAGVLAVVVLDDDSRTALLSMADQAPRRLGPDDELATPRSSRASPSRCGGSSSDRPARCSPSEQVPCRLREAARPCPAGGRRAALTRTATSR